MRLAALFPRRRQDEFSVQHNIKDLGRTGSWTAFILASIAASALIISAGCQNVAHAYNLGLASSEFRALVLAAASAGASILGPFCWLAVFRGRGFGTRCAALLLAVGCLAYAAVCSLGFVAGSRDTAIAGQQAVVDAYQDKRAIAAAARAELATLATIKIPSRQVIERRRELAGMLAAPPASRAPANPDSQAAAVAFYLNAAGWPVTAAAVGTWLNLGMVLFLELAAALGLSVAFGLYPSTRKIAPEAPPAGDNLGHPIVPARLETPASAAPAKRDDDDKADPPPPKPKGRPGRPAAILQKQALDKLRAAGGANGVRGVGRLLGVSKSTAHRILHQLATAGAITMTAGPRGVAVAVA
jgi:hypothetical protein